MDLRLWRLTDCGRLFIDGFINREIEDHAALDAISNIGVIIDDIVFSHAQFCRDVIDTLTGSSLIIIEFMTGNNRFWQVGLRLSHRYGQHDCG